MQGMSAASDARGAGGASKAQTTQFHFVIAGIALVTALVVITAALRLTERQIQRAVEEREAAQRFLASELPGLRLMAMSSESPVPARLYLGIEECFRKNAPMPFIGEDEAAARRTLAMCGQMELGRLHSQGGRAMAEKGRGVLAEVGLLN